MYILFINPEVLQRYCFLKHLITVFVLVKLRV
jgi:hypothetical protein